MVSYAYVKENVFIPSALLNDQTLSQGRANIAKFLAQNISQVFTGTYVPPFYQMSGVAIAEVCECMTCS